ncbi:MAG: hypothetical protein ACI8S6_001828 [Myxococcota bacterium]|jgi:hypothetical protein
MRSIRTLALLFAIPFVLVTPRAAAHLAAPDTEAWLAAEVDGWSKGEVPERVTALRALNPEYDLMARTFLSLALADRALDDPALAPQHLAAIDTMIADTLAAEAAGSQRHFLLPYADLAPFGGTGRSLFVDGELLVMMGSRRLIRDDRWGAEMQDRVGLVQANLGEDGLAESYPDEGWTFCHSMALVGLRMHEVLDGADHSAVTGAFLAFARSSLIHEPTGMLVSEFDMDGRHHDGPEGSSIWFATAALAAIDPELGAEQYALARQHLGRSILGLGYAREWPAGFDNGEDIDSGPVVPLIEASASSSGLAIAAAAAYGDVRWSGQLEDALGAAEILLATSPVLSASADNAVGRAVLLWGLGFGPTWQRLQGESAPLSRLR